MFEEFDELTKDFKEITLLYVDAIKKSAKKYNIEIDEIEIGNYESRVNISASTNGEYDIDFNGMMIYVKLKKSIDSLEKQKPRIIDNFIEDCEYCNKCEKGNHWLNMYFPFGIVEDFLRFFGVYYPRP